MKTDHKEEKDDQLPITKPESSASNKTAMGASSCSRVWSGLKLDPRIRRVYKGKDRHSKVSTIRGLRDRRVRLSVPTAIQLYDLQDRLGLNQPSKVVDWLLNAAQHEIDKLPPLQNFIDQFHKSLEASKAKNFRCLNVEGEQQIVEVGINYNAQSSSSNNQDHMLIPYASNYYHSDSSNNSTYNFSQLGILSSQVEVADPAASLLFSSTYMTAPCELDGRQLTYLQMGSSAQQNNLPLNTAIFRNSLNES